MLSILPTLSQALARNGDTPQVWEAVKQRGCFYSSPNILQMYISKHRYTYVDYFFFLPCHAACRVLVPQPQTEPVSPAVEAWNLNLKPWTALSISFYFEVAFGL